ncbi:MAG TPA: tRNA uridine-5-carboxymethylaminomethyl(34) synthesis GTPase MnmE, partial [Brevundimonas sp.]|nr:tRNA uridine-5-carboxymethylaminomethyl(34) synthesis GTPase MnmE [Brevundimonas sp.]
IRGPGDAEGDAAGFARPSDLLVLTKADLGAGRAVEGFETLSVSTATGQGLSELHDWIAARLAQDLSGADFPAVTRERHRRRLAEALCAAEAGRAALEVAPEMAGDDLRRAADALARVTGAIGVEDILGEVFSTFCIGK